MTTSRANILARIADAVERIAAALERGGVAAAPAPGSAAAPAPAVDESLPRMTLREVSPLYSEYCKGRMKESGRAAQINLLASGTLGGMLGNRYLDELDWLTLQKWIDGIERHTNSLKDFVGALKRLVAFARTREICRTPPEYDKPFAYKRYETKHGKEIPGDEYDRAMAYFKAHPDNCGCAGAYIAASTGLRIGEVCGLRVGDIDAEAGTISVERTVERVYDAITKKSEVLVLTPKSKNSRRKLPITPELMAFIQEQAKGAPEGGYVVRNPDGAGLEPRLLRSRYARALMDAHVPYYTFHSLRHTFISRHIRAGANPKAVCAYAGHSDLKMTIGTYTHINEDDLKGVSNV